MNNDIIIKITGQELIDLGYYIGEDKPEDKFNLHINISKMQIKIAPNVDGADFDHSWGFDYQETMADLKLKGHLSNGICGGVKYWYNNHSTETSSSCNPCDIAEICELSDDELSAFESLEDLNAFISGDFSFSFEPLYIAPEEVMKNMDIDIHINVNAKKITCYNSKKGIYETISFGEACIEDTADEADLKEHFEEIYPDNIVNMFFY